MFYSTADQHTTNNCTQWDHWENYTPMQKANLMSFALSSIDSLQVMSTVSLAIALLTSVPRTGFSGPGKSAQALLTTAHARHCGHTNLGWTMAGSHKTRMMPMYVFSLLKALSLF